MGAAEGVVEPPSGSTVTSSCAYLPASGTMTTSPGRENVGSGTGAPPPAGKPQAGYVRREAGLAIELTSAARPFATTTRPPASPPPLGSIGTTRAPGAAIRAA